MECIQHDELEPILADYGIDHVDLDQWYPLQTWLRVLDTIANRENAMQNLVSVGMAIAETVLFSTDENYSTMPGCMRRAVDALAAEHKGDFGTFSFEKPAPHEMDIAHQSPYPDDLIYGFVYGVARQCLGGNFVLRYAVDQLRRDKGGETTALRLSWSATPN